MRPTHFSHAKLGRVKRWALVVATAATLVGLLSGTTVQAGSPPPVDPTSSPRPTASSPPASDPKAPGELRIGREVLFNYPVPGTADLALSNRLVELINGTPQGERILLSFFVIQANHPVIDALLGAYSRGVDVQVVLDSGDGQKAKKNAAIDAAFARLAESFGSSTANPSFARQCNRSCITDEPASINHNKFAAFSRTENATDVVFQGTGNLRADGSGDSAYNAAVVIYGDAATYQQYVGYFQDLYSERRVSKDNYDGYRRPVTSGPVTAHFFPRTDDKDTLAGWLQTVNCSAQPTTVRVMAAFFSRISVRNTLTKLAKVGCAVQVLARQETITRDFCDRLDPSKVAVKIAPKPTKDRVTIHAKYVLVNGNYGGLNDRTVTWMGSHNFTDNALERNDETFVEFSDAQVNTAFAGNWDRLWNDPAMSAGCGRAGAKDNAAVERGGDTEITKIARRSQTVKRAMPKILRERQALRPVQTAQGRKLRATAVCKPLGAKGRLHRQAACRVVIRKGVPTLLLDSKRALRVRVTQRAKGSKRLLPFTRSADYRYRPKASAARRI